MFRRRSARVAVATAALVILAACNRQPLPTETGGELAATAADQATASSGLSTTTGGAKAPKVDICHREGNGSYHLINVSQNAEPAHLAHGDGKPGEAVPGSGGQEVFDAQCAVVACVFGEPEAVPPQFQEAGGQGTVAYGLSDPACGCSGQVTSGGGSWLDVGVGSVAGLTCSIGFNVTAWDGSSPGDSRVGSIGTPAGEADVLQVDGGSIASDIDLCATDPERFPICDTGDDGDNDACIPGVDCEG